MSRIALKIPTGWIVHYNELYDQEPCMADGSANSEFNDSEDLIWLQQLDHRELAKHVLEMAKHNKFPSKADQPEIRRLWEDFAKDIQVPILNIDVGWHTDKYRLVIYRGQWDEYIYETTCKTTSEITYLLNHCLENIHAYLSK